MAINREDQNWPDGMILVIEDNQGSVQTPYRHELNNTGTACAEDCPACLWLKGNKQ